MAPLGTFVQLSPFLEAPGTERKIKKGCAGVTSFPVQNSHSLLPLLAVSVSRPQTLDLRVMSSSSTWGMEAT